MDTPNTPLIAPSGHHGIVVMPTERYRTKKTGITLANHEYSKPFIPIYVYMYKSITFYKHIHGLYIYIKT